MPIDYQAISQKVLKENSLKPVAFDGKPVAFEDADFNAALKQRIEHIQDTKGKLVENDQDVKLRVYQGDSNNSLESTPLDLYQRGLHFARAALLVIEHDPEAKNKFENQNKEKFKQIIDEYSKRMLQFNEAYQKAKTESEKLENYKSAARLTHLELGALAHIVAEIKSSINAVTPKDAHSDIIKAADLLVMMNPTEDMICTVSKNDGQNGSLQFSRRLKLDNNESNADAFAKEWLVLNIHKHGLWLRNYVNQHWNELKTQPVPSSSRDLPNAANAWDETTVIKKGGKYQEIHSGRIGITTPFGLKTKDEDARKRYEQERIDHAAKASLDVLNPSQLRETAERFESRWGKLFKPEETVKLPILHATYVAPTFYYGADTKFVKEKTKANEIVRKSLQNKGVATTKEARTYEFDLLETNNCINIHRHMASEGPRNKEDSKALQSFALNIIKRANAVSQDTDFATVVQYLESANTFSPKRKGPTAEQKEAIKNVCKKLRVNPDYLTELSPDSQNDLSLLIQSSVALSQLNIGLSASQIFKFETFGTLLGGRNKETFKSAYEEIIADSVGYSISGCKSALDRKGEVEVMKNSILEAHATEGKIPDFYDTKSYRAFFTDYIVPNENQGHQKRLAATADFIGERKMWEVRPGQYLANSSAIKEMAKQGAAFRAPNIKWEKMWGKNNPFKSIVESVGGRFQPQPVPEPGAVGGNSAVHLGPPHPPLTFSSPAATQISQVNLTGAAITVDVYKELQNEFVKKQNPSTVKESGQFDRTYTFSNTPAVLDIKSQGAGTKLMMTMAPKTNDHSAIDIMAAQIQLMTAKGYIATIEVGPKEMQEALYNKCIENGIKADQIQTPHFDPKALKTSSLTPSSQHNIQTH